MGERVTRGVLGVAGVLLAAWGLRLLWLDRPYIKKINFGEWLIGGVLIHDLLIANVVVLVGWLLAKLLPPRGRGYVQAALIVMALTGSFAAFVWWRQGVSNSPSLALLQQNYLRNYLAICAVVAAGTALLYAVSLVRDRKSRSE